MTTVVSDDDHLHDLCTTNQDGDRESFLIEESQILCHVLVMSLGIVFSSCGVSCFSTILLKCSVNRGTFFCR